MSGLENFSNTSGNFSYAEFDFRIENYNKDTKDTNNKEIPKLGSTNGEFDSRKDSNDKISETKYLSTYKERLNQTPRNPENGTWQGKRGESKYVPNDEKVQAKLLEYNMDGVEYEDAIADFEKCSEGKVQIDDMTEYRHSTYTEDGYVKGNFEKASAKLAEQWNQEWKFEKNNWNEKAVEHWRKSNDLVWHECNDMKTCLLVDKSIHDACDHFGGVGECKRTNEIVGGGVFDD